jgi:hypothetical protein
VMMCGGLFGWCQAITSHKIASGANDGGAASPEQPES